MRTIGISFGALAPPIKKQLEEQGVVTKGIDLKHHQKDADAVTRLSVRGLMSEKAADTARKKILKGIIAAIKSAMNGA